MDNKELAKKLIELSGAQSNIKIYENCMTRLRIELNDYSKANIEELKKTEDVLGVVSGQNEIQIVLGPGKVAKVAECFKNELGNIANVTNNNEQAKNKTKKNKSFDVQEMLKKYPKFLFH